MGPVLLALAPLWGVGALMRGLWTPDEPREADIDWRESATAIERKVRAFNPLPGASTLAGNTALKIWRAQATRTEGEPGTILEAGPGGIVVACGGGALKVLELQRAGGKRLTAAQFLAGFPLAAGARLEFFPKTTI